VQSANTKPRPTVIDVDDKAILDTIVAPARPQTKRGQTINEGYRFLCLGESGCGKTSLMRAVVYYTLMERLANFAIVHDTKGIFAEYPRSVQVANIQEFVERRGFQPGDIPVASFRGDPRRDITVSAQDVANLSLMYARQGITTPGGQWRMNPHVTVIEEISEAATEGRKKVAAPAVLKLAEQGRKMGVSLLATTQETINMPQDLRAQATSMSFGRLTGISLNYLDRMNLPEPMIKAIRGPNGGGLPNYSFVLYVKGENEPWDGKVHRLNPRTVAMFE
jgi:ABC-type dipeptide/oligopeptide/nickel transport system ATPase component